jgi:hypothetical protein
MPAVGEVAAEPFLDAAVAGLRFRVTVAAKSDIGLHGQ